MPVTAERIGTAPIIHSAMNARLGENINGPSAIKVPDWVENPLGAYYLYFAHHMGRFIRLAYADRPEGPWTIHDPGVLDVEHSLFVTKDLVPSRTAPDGDWVQETAGLFLYAHVASPDVHVDEETRTIRMYYHGLLDNADQQTRLAVSNDGLRFEPKPDLLGLPYFRVFRHRDWIYAIAWGGSLYRSRNWEGPFETGPDVLQSPPAAADATTIRHVATHCRNDRLELFYTRIGDDPECILHTFIDLTQDWSRWQASAPTIVLIPELAWEGADLPRAVSEVGAAHGREHALRDPGIFVDDGQAYLFYSGAGESAIGVARLHGL